MDHEIDVLEFKPDDLQQIAAWIRSDDEHFGWVGVWFEIENGDGILEGVADRWVVDAMLVSRLVDLDINPLS